MVTERIRIWINALIHPKKTFTEEKPKASLKKALVNYAIFFLLLSPLISFCYIVIERILAHGISSMGNAIFVAVVIEVLLIIPLCILLFFAVILSNLIAHYIMKFLGGKATFTQQFYLTSLYPVLWLISTILVTIAANSFTHDLAVLWFASYPTEGNISSLDSIIYNPITYLLILLSLINLYWSILSTREAHNQSLIKSAVIALITNLVQWIIIFGAFYVLWKLFFSIISTFLSHGGLAPAGYIG